MKLGSAAAALAWFFGTAAGCVVAEPCDRVCEIARPAYEACMEQWGLAYNDGIQGYESADDYDGWCAVYNRERRLLASTADDPTAAEQDLLAECATQVDELESGDCGLYYSVFAVD